MIDLSKKFKTVISPFGKIFSLAGNDSINFSGLISKINKKIYSGNNRFQSNIDQFVIVAPSNDVKILASGNKLLCENKTYVVTDITDDLFGRTNITVAQEN